MSTMFWYPRSVALTNRAGLAVELPQDAELAHREHRGPSVDVDQDPLERLVHVVRLARQVLEVPAHLAGFRIECERRARVERVRVGAAAHLGPRLGLRHAPVGEAELRVVAPGDPGVSAAAEQHRQVAPGVAARFARPRHRRRPPQLAPGVGVVAGDEAALLPEPQAAGHAGDHHTVDDQGAAAVEVPLGSVGDLGLPDHLAGPRVERHDVRVGGVEDDLVLVDRDVAVRPAAAPRGRKLPPVLPQHVAGRRVERLHDVAGAGQVHHPFVHDGRGLLRSGLHRPRPDHPQVPDVGAVDLVQRAVTPAVLRPAPVQPALRRGIGQHRVGDRADRGRLRRRGSGEDENGERDNRYETSHRGLPFRLAARDRGIVSVPLIRTISRLRSGPLPWCRKGSRGSSAAAPEPDSMRAVTLHRTLAHRNGANR